MRGRWLTIALSVGGILCASVAGAADPSASLALAASAYLQQAANAAAVAYAHDLTNDPRSPVLGNPKGDVTLIEFFDYQCPYCKAAEPRIERLLKDDPRVKLVIKDFPILGPVSRIAARAVLASRAQGKYEAYHQAMMGFRGQLTEDRIFEIAQSVGLDVARLKRDMEAPEIADQIIANMNLARAVKVTLTPAFIVDTTVLSGVSADTETARIDFGAEVAAARKRSGK